MLAYFSLNNIYIFCIVQYVLQHCVYQNEIVYWFMVFKVCWCYGKTLFVCSSLLRCFLSNNLFWSRLWDDHFDSLLNVDSSLFGPCFRVYCFSYSICTADLLNVVCPPSVGSADRFSFNSGVHSGISLMHLSLQAITSSHLVCCFINEFFFQSINLISIISSLCFCMFLRWFLSHTPYFDSLRQHGKMHWLYSLLFMVMLSLLWKFPVLEILVV